MPTLKQRLGAWFIPKLPLSRHVFDHARLELNAMHVRALHRLHPRFRKKVQELRQQNDLLVNIGCGPFGLEGWVNLDLHPAPHITLVADCRRALPLRASSCLGIHVEHFFEHLAPEDERVQFLQECHRCLQPNGVLRIIVPNAELYIQSYMQPGWNGLNEIGCGGYKPEDVFSCKMEAINHVFHQNGEHYFGYDAESLESVLRSAGFTQVKRTDWRIGDFQGGSIDREQHRSYSLFVEAKR